MRVSLKVGKYRNKLTVSFENWPWPVANFFPQLVTYLGGSQVPWSTFLFVLNTFSFKGDFKGFVRTALQGQHCLAIIARPALLGQHWQAIIASLQRWTSVASEYLVDSVHRSQRRQPQLGNTALGNTET